MTRMEQPRSPVASLALMRHPGHGGDDAHDLAGRDRRVEVLQEADVLVGDEDVDEAPQRTRLVEDALAEPGVRGVELLQHVGDGSAFDRRPPTRHR